MKKSLKILTLVLSLALICGALVVAAFAGDTEVTGITKAYELSFTNQASGQLISDNKIATEVGSSQNQAFDREGIPEIIETDNGDKYFFWSGVTNPNKVNSNGYLNPLLGNTWNGNKYEKDSEGNYTGKTTQDWALYNTDVVVAHDFFVPEGYDLDSKPTFKIHVNALGKTNATGADRLSYCGYLNVIIYATTDADGNVYVSYTSNQTGTTYKKAVDRNSWTNVTTAVTTVDNGEYLELFVAIWINGEFLCYTPHYTTEGEVKLADQLATHTPIDKRTAFWFQDLRVQVNGVGAKVTDNDGIAYDNITVQKIDREAYKTSGGNLYDVIANEQPLDNWESSLYDRSKMNTGYTVVTNGDAEYDNLQYAVDCAEPGDELTLVKNIASGVIVNKDLYIVKNGYDVTGNVEGAKGYGVTESDEGWQIEESTGIEVEWGLCTCGLDICDETHPGDIVTEVNIGGNIFKSYEKDMNWSYVAEDGMTIIKLVGWQDDEGNIYTSESVMTAELAEACGEYLILNPILTVETPAYKFMQGGKETFGMAENMFLKDVVGKADAGSTVVILQDLAFTDKCMTITKDLTIDFGGKTIVSFTSANKTNLFDISNANVTFMTSVPGAMVIHGHDQGVANGKESFRGMAIFGVVNGKTEGSLTVKGEGLTTYSCMILSTMQGAALNTDITIDGGTYIQPSSIGDNGGMIQLRSFKSLTIKNATIHSVTRNMFAFWGCDYVTTPEEDITVNIDNCKLIGNGTNIATHSFDKLVVNFTNTVIGGNINIGYCQGKSSWGIAVRDNVPGGTWIIGEGCTIKSGLTIQATLQDATVKYADGYVAENYDATETYSFRYNTFSTGDLAASKVLSDPTEVSVTLNKKVVKYVAPISVNWVDANGALIGTTTATPGYVATAPAVAVEGNTWVMAQYTTWTNHAGVAGEALLPEDATDGYTFKLVEGSDANYVAGKVPVYINYDLVLHFQLNIYVPADAPEGVSNIAYIRSDGRARTFSKSNMTINGQKVLNGAEWPGIFGVDDTISITNVTFEYEGQSISYEVPSFNMGEYAKAVFNGEYSTEMKQAVLSTLNYVKAGHAYTTGKTLNASMDEAIALAAELGITVENVTVDTTVTGDITALAEYVKSAQIAIQNDGVALLLNKTDLALSEGAAISAYFLGSSNREQKSGNTNNNSWFWTNTRAYEFDEAVTIEIRNVETQEVLASGEYSALVYAAVIMNGDNQAAKDLIVATLTMAKYVEPIKNYNK